MKKSNFSTIIDLGQSNFKYGIFDNNFINIYLSSKDIREANSDEDYSKIINSLILDSEKKISNHIENIIVMYDIEKIFSVDISIKRIFDQKVNVKKTSSLLLQESIQLIKNNYITKKIIHFNITKYNIDSDYYFNKIDNELEAKSIILDVKFICLPIEKYTKIINIFKKNNINVSNFYCSSYVRSLSYLDSFKDFKDLIFLDIGFHRSTLIHFNNKVLFSLKSLGIGSNHITKDISKVLKISLEDSEKIKRSFNKSETEFSYNQPKVGENNNLIKKIIDKNISTELLKKVILARVEEIFELVFDELYLEDNKNYSNSLLVLIGNGSKLLNKNSFHFEERFNYKEINFYDENDIEICKAGLNFMTKNTQIDLINLNKKPPKKGIFEKFFNLFSR